ncbi:MAG TPA: hypothetical protein VLA00_08730 [Xanthobacteraceae bacterium]|nr:hypothetical protein [Xanthobacteraceae bacterium]
MKNLTITLSEQTLSRTRIAAAMEGKSMSRFVAELVEARVGRPMTQIEALEAFLAGPDLPGIATERPSREELYAERLFRGHERAAVPEGPDGTGEAENGPRLGRSAGRS